MTTAAKTKVQPTWDATRVREGAARVAANDLTAAFSVVERFGPEAIDKFEEAWTNGKIEYFKRSNVKTPLELVRLTAEFEANIFGSVLNFWGDENNATYSYESCGCHDLMVKEGRINPELGEKLGRFFEKSSQRIAKHFGFTSTFTREGKDNFPVITFKK